VVVPAVRHFTIKGGPTSRIAGIVEKEALPNSVVPLQSKSKDTGRHNLPIPPAPAKRASRTITIPPIPAALTATSLCVHNAKEILTSLSNLAGYIGSALVDSDSGELLASNGSSSLQFVVAAVGNTEVVVAQRKVAAALGLNDVIEDILITFGTQYHLIRPVTDSPSLFFYMALDRSKSNLAMARFKLSDAEKDLM
jgi:hypothetical protein